MGKYIFLLKSSSECITFSLLILEPVLLWIMQDDNINIEMMSENIARKPQCMFSSVIARGVNIEYR